MDGRLKDRSTRTQSGCGKTMKYMGSPINIIDLVSILPYYILLILNHAKASKGSIDILRMFRFLRFLLIFKLGRRFRLGGVIIGRTLRASTPALIIFLFLTIILAITFGSVMYFFEGGMFQVTQEFPAGGFLRPNARNTALEMSPFVSIFTGIYWFVVNTTTLGNCALFPTTTGGRIFSCVVAYIGLATLALPISIIGACACLPAGACGGGGCESTRQQIDSTPPSNPQKQARTSASSTTWYTTPWRRRRSRSRPSGARAGPPLPPTGSPAKRLTRAP